jgi:hypothetical protein
MEKGKRKQVIYKRSNMLSSSCYQTVDNGLKPILKKHKKKALVRERWRSEFNPYHRVEIKKYLHQ